MTPRTRRREAKELAAQAQYAELIGKRPLCPPTQARAGHRAAMYLRMSEDSTLLGEGIDRQWFDCWGKADDDDLDVVAVLIDNDRSAMSTELRPEYEHMKAMILGGEIDVVISLSQDRLLRQPRQMEDLITIADQGRPIVIKSVLDSDTDLVTASGRKSARDRAADAAFESERKAERQRKRNAQFARQGRTPLAPCFGYDLIRDPETKVFHAVLNPAQAAIVREVFQMSLSGVGPKAITRELNARGLRNTKGTEWAPISIRTMLLNPRYIGERWAQHNSKKTGKWITTREYIGQGDWEPIFKDDEVETIFREAGRRMASRGRKTSRPQTGEAKKWMGTSRYLCAPCNSGTKGEEYIGATVYARYDDRPIASDPNRMVLTYACRNFSHLFRDVLDTDAFVTLAVCAYLRRYGVGDMLKDDATTDQAANLKDQEATLKRKLQRVEDDYDDEVLTRDEYRAKKDRLADELAAVHEQQRTLGGGTHERLATWLHSAHDPAQRFLDAPLAVKGAIIDLLCEVTLINNGMRGKRPKNWTNLPGWRVSDLVKIEWRSGRTMDMTEFDVQPESA